MRMIDQTIGVSSRRPSVGLVGFLAAGLRPLAALLRAIGNRRTVNTLHDLTDDQLRDIGLARSDLDDAFASSAFFGDPSSHLTRAAYARRHGLKDLRDI